MHSVSLYRSSWGGMAPLLTPGTLFGAGSKFQSIGLGIFDVWCGADYRRSNWVGKHVRYTQLVYVGPNGEKWHPNQPQGPFLLQGQTVKVSKR